MTASLVAIVAADAVAWCTVQVGAGYIARAGLRRRELVWPRGDLRRR